MSKAKLEKDFQDFNLQIEKLASEEMERIKEKVETLKAEAGEIGEAVELSVKPSQNRKEKD
ncbi:MAG: hypothetical protein ABSF44_11170 [Candidatus Bathyarchaeia archaeon]|jgi:hypothetical protein